jgi:hypothetical protein
MWIWGLNAWKGSIQKAYASWKRRSVLLIRPNFSSPLHFLLDQSLLAPLIQPLAQRSCSARSRLHACMHACSPIQAPWSVGSWGRWCHLNPGMNASYMCTFVWWPHSTYRTSVNIQFHSPPRIIVGLQHLPFCLNCHYENVLAQNIAWLFEILSMCILYFKQTPHAVLGVIGSTNGEPKPAGARTQHPFNRLVPMPRPFGAPQSARRILYRRQSVHFSGARFRERCVNPIAIAQEVPWEKRYLPPARG